MASELTLSKTAARKLCDQIRSQAENLRVLLRRLHEEEGWVALGYATWAICLKEEFDYSERHANRLIAADKIDQQLGPIGPKLLESQARELAKVPEEQRSEVLAWAEEKAEGKPLTAAAIRKAAKEFTDKEPDDDDDDPADLEQEGRPEDIGAASEPSDEVEDEDDSEHGTSEESETGSFEAHVRWWMKRHAKPVCIMAAMLENLAAKLRTE